MVTRISRSVWTSALQAFLVAASIPSGWAANSIVYICLRGRWMHAARRVSGRCIVHSPQ